MLLFFDTETTGLWEKRLPCGDEGQPKIVQLGAMLVDPVARREVMRIDLIVYRPDPIPETASNIHKTTTAISQAIGVNENAALDIFCDMLQAAEMAVAHNIEFDVNIINNAARLLSGNPKLDVFLGKGKFCTMLAAVPVCKFPSKFGHKGYAWPKLEKAVPHLLGREPTAAHQAIGDVIDCHDLFFYLQDTAAERQASAA
jgi:DNA polymerase-3 subunit epsilon